MRAGSGVPQWLDVSIAPAARSITSVGAVSAAVNGTRSRCRADSFASENICIGFGSEANLGRIGRFHFIGSARRVHCDRSGLQDGPCGTLRRARRAQQSTSHQPYTIIWSAVSSHLFRDLWNRATRLWNNLRRGLCVRVLCIWKTDARVRGRYVGR
jgi:hypothetical protein